MVLKYFAHDAGRQGTRSHNVAEQQTGSEVILKPFAQGQATSGGVSTEPKKP